MIDKGRAITQATGLFKVSIGNLLKTIKSEHDCNFNNYSHYLCLQGKEDENGWFNSRKTARYCEVIFSRMLTLSHILSSTFFCSFHFEWKNRLKLIWPDYLHNVIIPLISPSTAKRKVCFFSLPISFVEMVFLLS